MGIAVDVERRSLSPHSRLKSLFRRRIPWAYAHGYMLSPHSRLRKPSLCDVEQVASQRETCEFVAPSEFRESSIVASPGIVAPQRSITSRARVTEDGNLGHAESIDETETYRYLS